MADRIVINFGAETREVEQAGRKISDVLGDTEDDLESVGNTGEQSLKDVTDAQGEVSDSAKTMNKDIEAGGEGFGGLADKADDALGGIGDSLLGVAGIAGGVGGVVTSVVGGAIDFVTGAIEDQQKAVQELKDRFADAYQTAAQEGRTFLTEAQIQAAALDIIFDSAARTKAQDEARAIGLDAETYIRALAGDQDALTRAIGLSAVAAEKVTDSLKGGVGAQGEALTNYDKSVNLASQVNDKLLQQQQIVNDNIDAAGLALSIQDDTTASIGRTADALDRLPRVIPVSVVPDTSALDAIERTTRIVRVDLRDIYGRALK